MAKATWCGLDVGMWRLDPDLREKSSRVVDCVLKAVE